MEVAPGGGGCGWASLVRRPGSGVSAAEKKALDLLVVSQSEPAVGSRVFGKPSVPSAQVK